MTTIQNITQQVVAKTALKRLDRRKRVEDMKHFMDFLSNKFPAISVRREYLLSERKFGQFYGEMMSGKSMAMAAMLHYYNMHGRTGVIGLQNTGDVIQFEGSIITYNKMYAKYYERKDWNTIPLEYEFVKSLGVDYANHVTDPNDLGDAFKPKGKAKVLVSIVHQVQFFRLTKMIYEQYGKDARCKPYCVVFDESHLTMSPNEADCHLDEVKVQVDVDSWPEILAKMTKYESVDLIIHNAEQVIATTATPAQNWFSDKYPIEFLIDITPGLGYRDLISVDFNLVPELNDTPVAEDPALHKVFNDLAKKKRYKADRYRMDRDHPLALQVQVSRYKADHYAIRDYILVNHPNKFVIITHNDEGSSMYFPRDISNHIRENLDSIVEIEYGYKELKTEYSILSDTNRVSFSSKAPVTAVLQFCANLPVKMLKRIVFIAGDRVKQGRRVNSEDFSIRMTHEFLRDETSTCDNSTQKWRMVGYVKDNRPALVGYCTESMHRNTITNIKNTRDILEKLKRELNDINSTRTLTAFSILDNATIAGDKIGSQPMCKNKMPMDETSDEEDDFDLKVSDYRRDLKRTHAETMDVVMPERKKKSKKKHRKLDQNVYFICKKDLPDPHHRLYDMAVKILKTRRNVWTKKAHIFKVHKDQNLTWHWSKYSESEGDSGLFMRKEKNQYEFMYV
jgi:hypothetical protein